MGKGGLGLRLFRVAGLVGVAALAAGCADSSPQADRRAPTTTGPTARPQTVPTSTTSTTSRTSRTSRTLPSSTTSTAVDDADATSIPVVSCPTSLAVTTPTMQLPSSARVDIPSTLASRVVVYSDSRAILMLLAPKGWTCNATFGADGSGDMTIVPTGETLPTGALAPHSTDKAITAGETGGSPVQAAFQACSLFPAAAQATESFLEKACSPPPASEKLSQISTSAIAFEDPEGIAGTGSPSGGENPANGVIAYSAKQSPGSYFSTCTLPQDEHETCTASLNYFISVHGEG